ncbi:hypothetical protein ACIQ8D_15185 [Streptomyces sp. NPDC096094]|uniref:hypothetical protein n=1 Tax=Streptomyces sp. NPDC096094 TaxID=3366073 RepID=UPI0037F4B043
MDRTDQLDQARDAIAEARHLAHEAAREALNRGSRATALAAASAAWSDIARTHTAIAAGLPDTTTED